MPSPTTLKYTGTMTYDTPDGPQTATVSVYHDANGISVVSDFDSLEGTQSAWIKPSGEIEAQCSPPEGFPGAPGPVETVYDPQTGTWVTP